MEHVDGHLPRNRYCALVVLEWNSMSCVLQETAFTEYFQLLCAQPVMLPAR